MILYILSNLVVFLLGTLLLNILDRKSVLSIAEKYILGFILGIAVNSFLLFVFAWSGVHITWVKYIDGLLILALLFLNFKLTLIQALIPKKANFTFQWNKRMLLMLPLVLLMLVKLIFSAYQSYNVPSYFDDEKGNWNWKSKNIYYEWIINTQSGSETYLWGGGHREYPLNFVLYKSYLADFMGEWNEHYINLITLVIFNLTVILLYLSFSNTTWGIITTYLIYSLPLVMWHAGVAYYDLTVACFYLLSFIFLHKFLASKENIYLILIGILLYSSIFTKNEGMVLAMPSLLLGIGYYLYTRKELKKIAYVIAPTLFLLPHMVFRALYHLSFNPHSWQATYGFHSDSINLYYTYFTQYGSYNIFWFVFLVVTIYLYRDLIKKENLGFTLSLWSLLFAIFLVFSITNNYQFLLDQTTINRTLLIFMIPTIYFYSSILSKRLWK